MSRAPSNYLTLSEAAKRIPGKPHVKTVRRWCLRGVHGVRLRSWKFGRQLCTTDAALDEFGKKLASRTRTEAGPGPKVDLKEDVIPESEVRDLGHAGDWFD